MRIIPGHPGSTRRARPRHRAATALRRARLTRAAAAAGLAALAGGLVTSAVPAAAATPAATAATAAPPAGGSGPSGLTAAQALASAQASGHAVAATALTTPTSQTTASPDGTLTLDQSLVPVRARSGGTWKNLDATLSKTGPSVAPALAASPLQLSPGGTGPLAVLTAAGRTLDLYWPGALPAPVLAGDTATYPGVLPGVDLAVTADTQGGISDALIVSTPAAAANPALASIRLRAVASPGLHLSADPAGDLTVGAGGGAAPLFTAPAPQMWDTAPVPAGTATTTAADGTVVSASSGLPALSTAAAPGAGATVTPVPVTVSGDTFTLAPPAAALAAVPAADFPVYIDPSFHDAAGGKATSWTQADSGFPAQSYWRESSSLQLGLCDFSGCNGMGVARSFFTLPVSGALTGAVITASTLYLEDVWSASCTAEGVQLWTTGAISAATDWNTQNASGFWKTDVQNQQFAYGYTGCDPAGHDVGFDVTPVMKSDAGNVSAQAFGIRAGDESNDLAWKQFASGAASITISTSYYFTPAKPAAAGANGACGTKASPSVIGNDDVTISATQSDKDQDPGISTAFTIADSTGKTVDTLTVSGAGENAAASTTIPRATLQGWSAAGGTYHFSAVTSDQNGAAGPASATCYFDWNPAAPAAPGLSVPLGQYAIGQQVTITFTPPPGCSPSTKPCPDGYIYQLGAAAPVTVSVGSGTCTADSCAVKVTVPQIGPVPVSVTGTANGNPGTPAAAGQFLTGVKPAVPYTDGYFSGGSHPDVLHVGTGPAPSLWLSPGTGNGTLGPAIDIGELGDGVPPASATGDGPADWAGAEVLHGNFTGDNVQDVLAYYPTGPSAGSGTIIQGSGAAATLNSTPAHETALGSLASTSTSTDSQKPGDVPVTLVAAGDASETDTGPGYDDLIGILGDPAAGYELDVYTTTPGLAGNYASVESPDQGAPDGPGGAPWNDFQLATAQPGGNPDDVLLLALDTADGTLWESQNPGCPDSCATGPIIGSAGTWTQITGTVPAALTSADINAAGQLEVWTASGTAITASVITGTTIAPEGTSAAAALPADAWALTDGASSCQTDTPAATTADTLAGAAAAITGDFAWNCDDTFQADLSLGVAGGTAAITPPALTLPATDTDPAISMWFRTSSTGGGILASLQQTAVGAGSATITGGKYNPVLYIGTDGLLHGEWWNGSSGPDIASLHPVNDGLWHHAVLQTAGTGTATTQTLTVDGAVQGTASGALDLAGDTADGVTTNLTFGDGYIGGGWPDQPYSGASGTAGYSFAGDLGAITLSAVRATSQKFTASGTFIAPAGVTAVKVQAWGGGGSGGNGSTSAGGGGGGGGEYAAEPSAAVTPGQSYTVTVGAGGSNSGGSTSSVTLDSVTVKAHGGAKGTFPADTGATGGAGGTGSTNTTHRDGGTGGTSTAAGGAGGGGGASGSATSAGAKGSAGSTSPGTGGAAGTGSGGGVGGGTGGDGGDNGTSPGGGGGGANAGGTGGNGGNGRIVLSWSYAPAPVITTTSLPPAQQGTGYPAPGSITRGVKSSPLSVTSEASTATITFPANPAPGSTVVVALWSDATTFPESVTDNGVVNASNDGQFFNPNGYASGHAVDYWVNENINLPATGTYAITVTFPAGVTGELDGGAIAYSGTADIENGDDNSGTSTTVTPISDGYSPEIPGSLELGAFVTGTSDANQGITSASTQFTQEFTQQNGDCCNAGALADYISPDGTGTPSWDLASSAAWAASYLAIAPQTPASGPAPALTATGITGTANWAVTSGTLPPGITLDPATGKLSGTPTTAGSYPVTVTVTDSATDKTSAPASLTITVSPSS